MVDSPDAQNAISPGGLSRSTRSGDVPEALRRRYYLDNRGGPGLGFYVDAGVAAAVFRDRGRRLTALRSDPNVIRDMTAIAQHRGWRTIVVRGDAGFRREAWLAGRSLGLEVQGYRPSARDLQALARRTERRRDDSSRPPSGPPRRRDPQQAAPDQLRLVEAVVRARVGEAGAQARILAAARERIADWLDRGASFARMTRLDRAKERGR